MRNPFALAIMQAMKPGIVSILKAETLAKIQEKPDETTQEIQNTNRYQKTNGRRLKMVHCKMKLHTLKTE